MTPMIHEALPTASVALLKYVLAEVGPHEPEPLGYSERKGASMPIDAATDLSSIATAPQKPN